MGERQKLLNHSTRHDAKQSQVKQPKWIRFPVPKFIPKKLFFRREKVKIFKLYDEILGGIPCYALRCVDVNNKF
jgi:hypothetical protein